MVEYPARQLDAVYAAIAHPVRRRVLDQLQPRGATVTELAAAHPMSLAAVSKHIRVLEDAGLVRRTIQGRERTAQGPFPMETTYTWDPVGEGRTRMTLRNRGESAGFSKIAAPLVALAMRRANQKDLAHLKTLLERMP